MASRSVPAALALTAMLAAACGRAWYDPLDRAADAGDVSGARDGAIIGDSDGGVHTSDAADGDTFLAESDPAVNFGGLGVVRTARSPRATALLRFDLGAVPAGAVAAAVTLEVSTSDAAQDPAGVRIYRVFEDWTEGGESGQPGAASWELRAPGEPWTTAGCGVGSRDAAARAELSIDLPDTRYQVALPTSVVQGWIDDPASNRGLALIATSGSGIELVSSEGADPERRPSLAVEWTR